MTDHGSSTLPHPPSAPPPTERRYPAVIGAVVAVVVAVAVGVGVGLLRDDPGPVLVDPEAAPPAPAGGVAGEANDDTSDGDPSSDDGADGTDSTTPDPVPTAPSGDDSGEDAGDDDAGDGGEEAVAEVLPELIAFVEEQRGLTFLETPTVVVLDDDAFVARFIEVTEEDLAEDPEDLELLTGILHALQMLQPDVTYEDAVRAFGVSSVLGYYDPEDSELVVRGGEVTTLVRTTIVHELVHALDDQHFELHRPQYEDSVDEIGFGFRSVVEGNARYIEESYRRTLSAQELAEELAEQSDLGGDFDPNALTVSFLDLQVAPYEFGELLAAELWAEGQDVLDGAVTDPPTTSEQVVVSGAYLAGEGRVEVAPPPADGEVLEEGVFGQILFDILLRGVVGDDEAGEAAGGWAGDWYVVWADGDDTCLRVDVVMDDGTERDELLGPLARWADAHGDASADLLDDTTIRLTACG